MRITPLAIVAGAAAAVALLFSQTRGAGEPGPTPAVADAGRPPAQVELTGDGRTYPGPYFFGRPDAPLLIVEYADFQ